MSNKTILLKKAYIKIMMKVIASGLISASKTDAEVRRELAGLKQGQVIQMLVDPNVAQFTVVVNADKTLRLIKPTHKTDLIIKFKHSALAFLVFSFQESTAIAFARDRIVADGSLSDSVRFVRCLNRLEALILPKFVAELAIKEYPETLSLSQKIRIATKIYAGLPKSFITGK